MKITGTRSTITFDLENGFLLKAQGELLINKKFVVYKDSMTQWEPPHENLPITQREIENIINTDKSYSWYDLIDKESGKLCPLIAKTITEKVGSEIAELFSDIVYRRNRIIHSFRCTSSKNEQILATKDRRTHKQFDIEAEYLLEFIKLNNKLSDLLHKYRGY